MPTLNWIGKDKVVTHHQDVPFRVLEKKYTFGDTPNSGNMIIHGDNLEALKALLPEYEGKIKCIYIDPPYNTGNEGWVYNDNVNDPHIKKWLGKVVGSEVDDLTRHDKWLCMMYPRLVLLQRLLSEDGAIFISIDDNEHANLKLICDEIFGSTNFVMSISWRRTDNQANIGKFAKVSEYIYLYAKNNNLCKLGKLPLSDKAISEYQYEDERGKYGRGQLKDAVRGKHEYDIVTPEGLICKGPWLIPDTEFKELLEKDLIHWPQREGGTPRLKIYLKDMIDKGQIPNNFWGIEFGTNQRAAKILDNIFGKRIFDFPKPPSLIENIVSIGAPDKNSIILDSFAGSGTTAHAVLNLNKKDGGNRKFILCEMMDYADTITAERVKKVISGYDAKSETETELYSEPLTIKKLKNGAVFLEEAQKVYEENKGKYDKISSPKIVSNCLRVIGTTINKEHTEGTGGSFDFYELGETIFNPETNLLNNEVDTEKIRKYIWFSETNMAYSAPSKDAHPYLLGSARGTNYYFYYKKDEETCLDWAFLRTFTQRDKAEMYVIYADRCVLTQEEMTKMNIRFKQIPRDIKRV